jgi:hypothetical protein
LTRRLVFTTEALHWRREIALRVYFSRFSQTIRNSALVYGDRLLEK